MVPCHHHLSISKTEEALASVRGFFKRVPDRATLLP
jgi:hypothetical protein